MFDFIRGLIETPDDSIIGTVDFKRKVQWDGYSCGAKCVYAAIKHFDIDVDYDDVVDGVNTTEDGTSATPIVKYVRSVGLRAGWRQRMSISQLKRALAGGSVAIVDLDGTHWAVVHAISDDWVWVADPVIRKFVPKMLRSQFKARWRREAVVVGLR